MAEKLEGGKTQEDREDAKTALTTLLNLAEKARKADLVEAFNAGVKPLLETNVLRLRKSGVMPISPMVCQLPFCCAPGGLAVFVLSNCTAADSCFRLALVHVFACTVHHRVHMPCVFRQYGVSLVLVYTCLNLR